VRKIILIFIMGITLSPAFAGVAFSHPHVFIALRLKAVFDDKGLACFNVQWEFDEMFSSMIADDYDKNQNGIFEKAEIALIKDEAFSYLANYNYFTFIKINGKAFDVKFIKNFSPRLINNKLIYEFIIPCHVTALSKFKNITVAAYDPSYYTAIFFAKKNSVSLVNPGIFKIETTIKEDKTTLIYFDMINPWALFLNFCKK